MQHECTIVSVTFFRQSDRLQGNYGILMLRSPAPRKRGCPARPPAFLAA